MNFYQNVKIINKHKIHSFVKHVFPSRRIDAKNLPAPLERQVIDTTNPNNNDGLNNNNKFTRKKRFM